MKEFFTRQIANEGVTLPLYHPDGTPSEHWIKVRGVDSDHFRKAETKAKREAMNLAQLDNEQEKAEAIRETELDCIAALVAGWSFEPECTQNNVVNFLREAPQIADMINRFAVRRSEFFGKKPGSSANGSRQKSSSKKFRKARKSS